MLLLRPFALSLVFVSLASVAGAQEPVAVGRGSYASQPPKGKVVDAKRNVDLVEEVETRPIYLVKDDGRPIPTNKWYENLLLKQYGTGLWALPHKVDATPEGIELFFPTGADAGGTRMIAEFPLVLGGKNFRPVDSRAKQWSDWTIAFRLHESDERHVDVTLGEGMPYVWLEYVGVEPKLSFGGNGGKGSRGKNRPTFFTLAGKSQSLPARGDTLGVVYEGRTYAVFAPNDTEFAADGDDVAIRFAGAKRFLVVCPLPSASHVELFHRHAFAVPRETRLSWKYHRPAGTIATTWSIETETLQGTEDRVLQGWLPHHWRDNQTPPEYVDATFTTIRGPLRYAVGREFTITYPFHGILPNLPQPTIDGGFDGARMSTYLKDYFSESKKGLAADTYFGGKDLQRYVQAAFAAQQLGDSTFGPIVGRVRAELENWLTFTPGEKERYFAYFPRTKGLVGFNTSFGSQHFTDHHFHNGYFIFTAGLLSQLQPDFAEQYGEMARLVAKSYANYDRADDRFPFFRTFDIWRGHSFADGKGFPDGNNQESTGEAMNSWVGLILLGEALGDEEMTAAGVMGYTFETRANVEYWFDPHGDVFPKTYPHEACGMIWCNSIVWGTWFTASPAWIYGIQWLPSGPWMSFYDRDPKFIDRVYGDVRRELAAFEEREAAKKPEYVKKPVETKTLGGELGSYHLGFRMHADAAAVVAELDRLWAESDDKVAHNEWMAGIYYQAHALKTLGRVEWTVHADSPTATAYVNAQTKMPTYVAWNPSEKARVVTFASKGKPLGRLTVPPRSTAAVHQLDAIQ
jgi:endoglucanase Acf2